MNKLNMQQIDEIEYLLLYETDQFLHYLEHETPNLDKTDIDIIIGMAGDIKPSYYSRVVPILEQYLKHNFAPVRESTIYSLLKISESVDSDIDTLPLLRNHLEVETSPTLQKLLKRELA